MREGVDWLGLLATLMLGTISCIALWLGDSVVAGTAAGAIAGYMVRTYQ